MIDKETAIYELGKLHGKQEVLKATRRKGDTGWVEDYLKWRKKQP